MTVQEEGQQKGTTGEQREGEKMSDVTAATRH